MLNSLRPLLLLLSRYFYIFLALLICALLPYSAHFSIEAFRAYQKAKEGVAMAEIVAQYNDKNRTKLKEYKEFRASVEKFKNEAQESRILEEYWAPYTVNFQHRLVNVSEIRTFLENTRTSTRYYFHPKHLEILSLFATELLPKKIVEQMSGKGRYTDKTTEPLIPGEKVLLSLEGTYWVFQAL
ncbi:MAG: hypothetical protein H7832_14765 [Magnetococcus sp. DMHC-6]